MKIISKPKLLEISKFFDTRGQLAVLELPFEVNRIYYLKNIPLEESRGHHAHKELAQIFCAVKGSFQLRLSTPFEESIFKIQENGPSLFLPPGYWRTLEHFSDDAISLVLASLHYDKEDYIDTFDKYIEWFMKEYSN